MSDHHRPGPTGYSSKASTPVRIVVAVMLGHGTLCGCLRPNEIVAIDVFVGSTCWSVALGMMIKVAEPSTWPAGSGWPDAEMADVNELLRAASAQTGLRDSARIPSARVGIDLDAVRPLFAKCTATAKGWTAHESAWKATLYMPVDLTGGIDPSREFVFASRPEDAEMRDSVSFWVIDDRGEVALSRIGIEAVAANFAYHDIQVNAAFPDGRVFRRRANGPSPPADGPDGRPPVLGAGGLAFRCVEPSQTWTMTYDGNAVVATSSGIRDASSSRLESDAMNTEVASTPADGAVIEATRGRRWSRRRANRDLPAIRGQPGCSGCAGGTPLSSATAGAADTADSIATG